MVTNVPIAAGSATSYRYCPTISQDTGEYTFEVLGNARSTQPTDPTLEKYWQEIRWEIYDELTGQTYYGNAETKMTFVWDEEDLYFSMQQIERPYEPAETCQQCVKHAPRKPKPTPKPKSKPKAEAKAKAKPTPEEHAHKDEDHPGDVHAAPAEYFDSSGDTARRRLNVQPYPTPSPTVTMSPTIPQVDYGSPYLFQMEVTDGESQWYQEGDEGSSKRKWLLLYTCTHTYTYMQTYTHIHT